MAIMTVEQTGKEVEKFRPVGQAVLPYNIAALKCPECGLVALEISPALPTAVENAANVIEKRGQVRVQLAHHFQGEMALPDGRATLNCPECGLVIPRAQFAQHLQEHTG